VFDSKLIFLQIQDEGGEPEPTSGGASFGMQFLNPEPVFSGE